MFTEQFVAEYSANMQEMDDMISVLGSDCKAHFDTTQNTGDQSARRAYIRAVFAFIEGVTNRMKEIARHFGRETATLSPEELIVLEDLHLKTDDKGNIARENYYPHFLSNIRFAFKQFPKSFGSPFILDCSKSGWENLKRSVKVRNRLMHPKTASDLEVTDAELASSKIAFDWFFIAVYLCGLYNQKMVYEKSTPSLENIAILCERILETEDEIALRGL